MYYQHGPVSSKLFIGMWLLASHIEMLSIKKAAQLERRKREFDMNCKPILDQCFFARLVFAGLSLPIVVQFFVAFGAPTV